jgi:serine protease
MIRRWLFGAERGRSAGMRRARKRVFCRLKIESLEERRLLAVVDDDSQLVVDPTQSATSLIVQFKSGADFASSLTAYSYGASLGESWSLVPDLRQVHLNAGVNVQDALAAYASDPNVVQVEPDYHVKLQSFNVPPNDNNYNDQWDLHNTGQQGGYPGSDIHMEDAWRAINELEAQGTPLATVVVAVIDTGVDYTHPDLAPVMWTNPGESGSLAHNGKDDDHDGYIDDLYGYNFVDNKGDPMDDFFHGTHVAGTIGAVADNGIGVAGIAPNVQIMALKFLDSEGSGVESDAIRALNYAVAHGASISNNSWGGLPFSSAFQTALSNAAAHGHIFVAAAGNNSSNNDSQAFYPANYTNTNVVSVAATDAGDALAYFSNYGKKTVDIGAPGVSIFSTLPMHETLGMQYDGLNPEYGVLNGTSMAAPHVTAVLALIRGLHPDWTMQEVLDNLKADIDPISGLAPLIATGGRLNAAAVFGVTPSDSVPPQFVSGDPSNAAPSPVDHVRIKFSEPMNPDTFDFSDIVSFDGPDGPVLSNGPDGPVYALSVSPVNGDNTTFDVTFDAQSTPGNYTLVIGSDIEDMGHNRIDQNGDGSSDDNDNFQVSFSILPAGSSSGPYSSTDVPTPISGFSVITSHLTIDQDLPIADVNVALNLTYPRDGNLKIWLVSPAGTSVTLSQRRGGNLVNASANFTDTDFDDQADTPIAMGSAPFTGTFQPDEPLSTFDNENAFGTWQLNIQNLSAKSRQGTINSWSLNITPSDTATGGGGDGGGGGGGDGGGGDGGGGTQDDPPQPQDDNFTFFDGDPVVIATSDLLSNDTDPNNDLLSVVAVDNPVGGNVVLNFDGTITFTPEFGSLIPVNFEYSVFDGYMISTAHVYVNFQFFYDYHNYNDPNDVDNDGVISASDVITIINYINAHPGSPDLVGHRAAPTGSSKGFIDVVPDNIVAASDVIAIINYINAHPNRLSVSTQSSTSEMAASSSTTDSDLHPAAVDAVLLSSTLDSGLSSKKK